MAKVAETATGARVKEMGRHRIQDLTSESRYILSRKSQTILDAYDDGPAHCASNRGEGEYHQMPEAIVSKLIDIARFLYAKMKPMNGIYYQIVY